MQGFPEGFLWGGATVGNQYEGGWDDYRIDYHRANIASMRDAIVLDDVELIGYTTWGCASTLSPRGRAR